jgi:hypothetical protein
MPAKSVTSGSILRPSFSATAFRMSLSRPVSLSPATEVYGAYGWTATFRTPGSMVSRLAAVPDTAAVSSPEHAVSARVMRTLTRPAVHRRMKREFDMLGPSVTESPRAGDGVTALRSRGVGEVGGILLTRSTLRMPGPPVTGR